MKTRSTSLADAFERFLESSSFTRRTREMFFSRAVGTLLDKYLATRGHPTSGPLFVTHRKARLPRRADLDADGYALLSYYQADTLWKGYTPDWDLHQLRHTAISLRAAHDYTEVDLKRFRQRRNWVSLREKKTERMPLRISQTSRAQAHLIHLDRPPGQRER